MAFNELNDVSTPIRGGGAVTPGANLPVGVRALWIGTGGDVVVETRMGDTMTFTNVADGTLLPVHAAKVTVATSATDITYCY